MKFFSFLLLILLLAQNVEGMELKGKWDIGANLSGLVWDGGEGELAYGITSRVLFVGGPYFSFVKKEIENYGFDIGFRYFTKVPQKIASYLEPNFNFYHSKTYNSSTANINLNGGVEYFINDCLGLAVYAPVIHIHKNSNGTYSGSFCPDLTIFLRFYFKI
ncbi:MAG: hypothetical protein PHE49_04550 [bacterium]|nr:hypothetical protein [bacterium]